MHEAIEVYLVSMPFVWQRDAYALSPAIGRSRQLVVVQLRAEGQQVDLVVGVGTHAQRVLLELHRHRVRRQRGGMELHRRHGTLADHKCLVVNHQTPLAVQREAPLVQLLETVALRHVEPQRRLSQAQTQRRAQCRGIVHHRLEQASVGLLRLGARVVYKTRLGPHTPFATPLVADHRPHRAAKTIVDSKSLFCHLLDF